VHPPAGDRLADSGPNSQRIARAARSPDLADQVLASLFWWCYVRTQDFQRDLDSDIDPLQDQRQIIVSHADDTRHDLLVLAPNVPETFGVTVRPVQSYGLVRGALGGISDVALAEGARMRAMLARANIDVDVRSIILAVTELADRADFRLVVAAEPDETPTEAPTMMGAPVQSFVAPAPALPVTIGGEPDAVATAGVIGADGAGGVLAITAWHAVSAASVMAVEIRVGGAAASVVRRDKLTDSCLLSVTCRDWAGVGRAGLLRFAPAEHRPATFDGAGSGHKQTKIRAYDLSVLDSSPYLSSKVYTDPDTVPGDSGSALIDSEDHIVGFAVSRTAFGAPLEFSTWSWAGQVLAAHGLT
jgi:hypothetical protein